MKTIELEAYLGGIKARKAKLAADGLSVVESCRNGGGRRTPEKRAALKRAENRAKAAGVQPISANF